MFQGIYDDFRAEPVVKAGTEAEYTVSEIAGVIKRSLEKDFSSVRVRGEVSGLKIAPSGHVYFSLKDKNAVLAAICWRGQHSAMQHKPQEGLEMVCIGELTTYPLQSKYQLIVQSVKAAGVGALMALLEKRKQQFLEEGLFDARHKKTLPFLPRTIGVITSPTGAVIQDILHRIEDRFPMTVLIWPVLVQGDKSAQQVAEAIAGFNRAEGALRPDVLIVARGGGSIEDLWPFNEEMVVRAAFASVIPIISAVGHETDTTLLDYAADVRAPTPTAAAELAVPLRRDLIFAVNELKKRQQLGLLKYIEYRQALMSLARNLTARLDMIVFNSAQKLDELAFRLIEAMDRQLNNLSQRLGTFEERLSAKALLASIVRSDERTIELWLRIAKAASDSVERKGREVSYLGQLLGSFDYKNVLKRGFALVRGKDGRILKSVKDIGDEFAIEMQDGVVEVVDATFRLIGKC